MNTSPIKARMLAIRWLIETHPDEFAVLHGDARISFGLSRDTNNRAEKLRKRIERLEARLQELREQELELVRA